MADETTYDPFTTNNGIYSCDLCGDGFTERIVLMMHKDVEHSQHIITNGMERNSSVEKNAVNRCRFCLKVFKTNLSLTTHERKHTGEKPFSCDTCGKTFAQKCQLVEHERLHTGEKAFPCEYCGKHFAQKSNLIHHRKIHTGERPFSCVICGKSFRRTCDLTKHNLVHNGNRRPVQKNSDSRKDKLSEYLIKPYSCEICGTSFARKDNFKRHKSLLHRVNGSESSGHFVICEDSLKPQIKEEMGDSDIKQEIKEEIIDANEDLFDQEVLDNYNNDAKKSDKDVGIVDKLMPPLNPSLKIGKDSFTFTGQLSHNNGNNECHLATTVEFDSTEVNLKQEAKEERDGLFSSYICGMSFKRTCKLTPNKKDLQTSGNEITETLYSCEICGTYFETKDFLTRHTIQDHCVESTGSVISSDIDNVKVKKEDKVNDDIPCTREIKEEMFDESVNVVMLNDTEDLISGDAIEAHINVDVDNNIQHTLPVTHLVIESSFSVENKVGNRCRFCLKVFRTYSSLTSHERIHTGEKPFSCHTCGKSFVQKGQLVEHERLHTGEKAFPCEYCGKHFAQKSNLIHHRKIHTGERPFSCVICGKTFRRTCDLSKHNLVHSGKRRIKKK